MVSAEEHGEAIRLGIRCRTVGALCPGCGVWSSRVHGSYLRFPADLPSAGRNVVLRLHVRRFVCADPSCERRTFAEQIPGLTRRYSRWTERLRSALAEVGLALASRTYSGSRSAAALLRLVDALPEPRPRAPRVVGVDEYAMRKGRSTGPCWWTSRPAGPLTCCRTARRERPQPGSANVRGSICRDRAPFFAEGARTGAPTALQVADRFHLWHNLGEAAERCVSRHRICLRAPFTLPRQETAKTPQPSDEAPASPWPTGHRFADRTREKHAIVHALLSQGHSRRAIGRQLHMTHRTVKRLADAAAPTHWGQGIGSQLHATFIQYLHEAALPIGQVEAWDRNHRAQAFYFQHGWRPTGHRRQGPDRSSYIRMHLNAVKA